MLAGHQRSHLGRGVIPGADLHRRNALGDRVDDALPDVADRHHGRDRHAALAGRPVPGGHRRVGGRLEIRVGEHHHVVLGPAERLHPLAVARTGLVDVARHRGRADKRERRDIRMVEQPVHRLACPLDYREHPVGKSRPAPEVGEEQ